MSSKVGKSRIESKGGGEVVTLPSLLHRRRGGEVVTRPPFLIEGGGGRWSPYPPCFIEGGGGGGHPPPPFLIEGGGEVVTFPPLCLVEGGGGGAHPPPLNFVWAKLGELSRTVKPSTAQTVPARGDQLGPSGLVSALGSIGSRSQPTIQTKIERKSTDMWLYHDCLAKRC